MTEPDMACRGEPMPGTASIGEQGRVVKWVADRTEPTSDPSAVAIEDLHMDNEVCCLSNGQQR